MKNSLPITLVLATASLFACNAGAAANGPTDTAPSAPVPTPASIRAIATSNLPAGGKPANWHLVWSDEFNTDGLPDPAKWKYDTEYNKAGWYNHELQYYGNARLENTRIADGKLIITARRETLPSLPDYNGQAYTSGALITRGLASWTYGFIEVRAKLPCGVGTWPAIWTLGTKGKWPRDGEIDIMEHVGKMPDQIFGSIHTEAENLAMKTQRINWITVADACTAFHNYQLTWSEDRVVIGIDGRNHVQLANPKDGDYKKWPFSSPQYLLINLAIGGDFGGPVVDDNSFPQQMEVDYVRIYQP